MTARRFDLLVFVAVVVGIAGYTHHDVRNVDKRQTHRNCLAIENLKAGQREEAQATVDGDNLLLFRHAKFGDPLPVPRAAIVADRAAKLKTVHRYPPRECPKP